MVQIWGFQSVEESFPTDNFDSFDHYSSLSSLNREFNKIMEAQRQHFRQMNALSQSINKAHDTELKNIKIKLASVTPVCTTVRNPPRASSRNIQKDEVIPAQTTTCVKELVIDGKKHVYKEITVTDNNGKIVSQYDDYNSYLANSSFSSSVTNSG